MRLKGGVFEDYRKGVDLRAELSQSSVCVCVCVSRGGGGGLSLIKVGR